MELSMCHLYLFFSAKSTKFCHQISSWFYANNLTIFSYAFAFINTWYHRRNMRNYKWGQKYMDSLLQQDLFYIIAKAFFTFSAYMLVVAGEVWESPHTMYTRYNCENSFDLLYILFSVPTYSADKRKYESLIYALEHTNCEFYTEVNCESAPPVNMPHPRNPLTTTEKRPPLFPQ